MRTFASRDRLELAWVRGREEDGPLWCVDVSMQHFARAASFEELPALLTALETAAPPGPGLRWGLSSTFVSRAGLEALESYDWGACEGPDEALRVLADHEQRGSWYSVYMNAIEGARMSDDGSDRARAVLACLEARAAERLGRVPV